MCQYHFLRITVLHIITKIIIFICRMKQKKIGPVGLSMLCVRHFLLSMCHGHFIVIQCNF